MKVQLLAAQKPISPLPPKNKLPDRYDSLIGDHAPEREDYDSDEEYDAAKYTYHHCNIIFYKNSLKDGDGWSRGYKEDQGNARRRIRFHEGEMRKLEQKYRGYAPAK